MSSNRRPWGEPGVGAALKAGREEIGAKLNRLLFGFLETEILPQATRRLSWASTRCRGWTIVAAVVRLYADALERPNGATY